MTLTGTSIVASRPAVARARIRTTYAPSGSARPSNDDRPRPGAPPRPRLELGDGRSGRVEDGDGHVRVGAQRERDRGRVRLPVAVRRDRRRCRRRLGELQRRRARSSRCCRSRRSLRGSRSASVAPSTGARRQPRPVDGGARPRAPCELDPGGVGHDDRPRQRGREPRGEARAAGLVRRGGRRVDLRQAERGDPLGELGISAYNASPGHVVRPVSRCPEIARRKTGIPGSKRSLPDEIPLRVAERIDVGEVEPPGERLDERVERGLRRRDGPEVAHHGDAEGARVEPARVGADDVPVDPAGAPLVHRAEAVDERVVADVVPAVALDVVRLDRPDDRRRLRAACRCSSRPCGGRAPCGASRRRPASPARSTRPPARHCGARCAAPRPTRSCGAEHGRSGSERSTHAHASPVRSPSPRAGPRYRPRRARSSASGRSRRALDAAGVGPVALVLANGRPPRPPVPAATRPQLEAARSLPVDADELERASRSSRPRASARRAAGARGRGASPAPPSPTPEHEAGEHDEGGSKGHEGSTNVAQQGFSGKAGGPSLTECLPRLLGLQAA